MWIYGVIGLRNTEWIQGSINILILIFRRVFLMINVAKSKTTTCQTGVIRKGMSEKYFSWRSTEEGAMYRENLRRCIPCPDCGVEFTSGYM